MDEKMMLQGKQEWEAWQTFVKEWSRIHPDLPLNDQSYNRLVNAIRYWGEELVALRLLQEGTVRGTALVEARQSYERAVRDDHRLRHPATASGDD